MIITSKFFFGGVPDASVAESKLKMQNDVTNIKFSGCMGDITLLSKLDLQSSVDSFVNVEFDGCPAMNNDSLMTSSCQGQQIHQIYDGDRLDTRDGGLKPYTEYMYRVKSYHPRIVGYGVSDWVPVRSGEGGK